MDESARKNFNSVSLSVQPSDATQYLDGFYLDIALAPGIIVSWGNCALPREDLFYLLWLPLGNCVLCLRSGIIPACLEHLLNYPDGKENVFCSWFGHLKRCRPYCFYPLLSLLHTQMAKGVDNILHLICSFIAATFQVHFLFWALLW